MSAPEWEAPRELYFYDEWLQQNAKGRLLCGNNRYVLCTHTDERVKELEAENARLRDALSLYSCDDGCNDCPEHERDRVSCGWTALRALE